MKMAYQEMAHRKSDGIEVALLWAHDEFTGHDDFQVTVQDTRTGTNFTLSPETGKAALFAYRHPFAAGNQALKSGRIVGNLS